MFGKILNTFLSKFLIALLNFLIVIVTANQLGASGRGVVSLIVLSITINQLISGLVGGTALIYLAPRQPILELLIPSYFWAVLSSLIGTFILSTLNLLPSQYSMDIFFISVLQGFGFIHLNLFIGQEKIKRFNIISALQIIISLISLLFCFYFINQKTVRSYIISQYTSFGYLFLSSAFFVFQDTNWTSQSNWGSTLKAILQNSFYIQLATVVQLFNYRLSYYMIDRYMDKSSLGVYSTAVSVSESLWLISRSFVMIQYSKVVNSFELHTSRKLTLQMAKFSLLATILCGMVLLTLPKDFFTWLFGKDFNAIKQLLIYLLPGVACIANSTIYAHYYAGIGKNHINTIGSSIGFVFTLVFCYILIPQLHLVGAAISCSISYFTHSVFLIYLFKKEACYKWKDFLLTNTEISDAFIEAKKIWKKSNDLR